MGPVVSSSGTCLSSPFIAYLYCFFNRFFFFLIFPNEGRAAVLLPQVMSLQGALSYKLLSSLCLSLASGHPILSVPQGLSSCPCSVAASILLLSCSSSLMQQNILTSSCSSLTSCSICIDAPETLGRVLRAAVGDHVLCHVSTI